MRRMYNTRTMKRGKGPHDDKDTKGEGEVTREGEVTGDVHDAGRRRTQNEEEESAEEWADTQLNFK